MTFIQLDISNIAYDLSHFRERTKATGRAPGSLLEGIRKILGVRIGQGICNFADSHLGIDQVILCDLQTTVFVILIRRHAEFGRKPVDNMILE